VRCSGLEDQPVDSEWTIASDGVDRSALVHIPPGYDPTIGTAVVLNFHGFQGNADQQAGLSQMTADADDAGYIVVYPEGTGFVQSWNGGACCGTAASSDTDDVQFASDLIDELGRRLCVDPDRIYSTGMSNGGFLSHRLGCELSDRIAAIAPVAGVIGVDSCEPTRPLPVIQFHGTSDTLVPYEGSTISGYPSVAETIDGWAERNGCAGGDLELVSENGDSRCEQVPGCPDDAPVMVCTVEDGGHTWPGGTPVPILGKTTQDLDANAVMWELFSR
jgi:polyhydroxybutyrate depolymerase